MYFKCFIFTKKNATPIPPKSAEQTKAILMQFPVSSGQHHRANESEWVPVEPQKPPKKDKEVSEQSTTSETTKSKTDTTKATVIPSKSKVNDDIPLPTTGITSKNIFIYFLYNKYVFLFSIKRLWIFNFNVHTTS